MIVALAITLLQNPAWSMDLNDYLKNVENKHRGIRSLETSIDAAQDGKESGDLELTPLLTLSGTIADDKKTPNQFATLGGTETKTSSYSLGLNKKFSTGTDIGVSASAIEVENPGVTTASLAKFGTGSLGVSLSQSLWKNAFGSATRLRWDREEHVFSATKAQYELQKRAILVSAEAAYWDYIYSQEQLKIRQASLERARKIETWMNRRVSDGISDRADLLQTQSLVATRQLQLISAQSDFVAAQKAVRDYLEISDKEILPDLKGDISLARSLQSSLQGRGSKVVQLEAYAANATALAKATLAKETEDSYSPDLKLIAAYNTNSFQANMGKAVNKWTDTDTPTTSVGLSLTYYFETDAKSSAKSMAQKEALAAKYTSERKMLESATAWSELNRNYNELSKQIESASKVSSLQSQLAKAQVDKFNKGRAITTDVVNSEEEAAEAELSLTKLKSAQRKMEAQVKLFQLIQE